MFKNGLHQVEALVVVDLGRNQFLENTQQRRLGINMIMRSIGSQIKIYVSYQLIHWNLTGSSANKCLQQSDQRTNVSRPFVENRHQEAREKCHVGFRHTSRGSQFQQQRK